MPTYVLTNIVLDVVIWHFRTPDPSSNEAPSDSVSETSENEEEKFKISEYELQVQKNIKERQKMFEMLRIKDAKKELTNIL